MPTPAGAAALRGLERSPSQASGVGSVRQAEMERGQWHPRTEDALRDDPWKSQKWDDPWKSQKRSRLIASFLTQPEADLQQ